MIKSKLGFGPMSPEIIDSIMEYSLQRDVQLMIIASRNQVDTEKVGGGYVCSTENFFNLIDKQDRKNVLICRDHCGPYFSDSEKNLSLKMAVEETKKTIAKDIEMGFDLIHIDTSHCGGEEYTVAEELFEYCNKLNQNIKFEFGSEENIGVSASVDKYQKDVKFASSFSKGVEFVVGQTGSLVYEDKQVGNFDSEVTKKLVSVAKELGVKFKEHNADYLNDEQIKLRKECGVDAMNIAPEFGVIQTKLLYELTKNTTEWNNFSEKVINSKKWQKWIPKEADNLQKVFVSGHYNFNSDEYRKIFDILDYDRFLSDLKVILFSRFDQYVNNT